MCQTLPFNIPRLRKSSQLQLAVQRRDEPAMATKLKLVNAFIYSLIFSLHFFLGSSSTESHHDLRISNAERRIDLSSHIIKVFLTLKVENKGVSPMSEVILAFPPVEADHLALLKAAVPGGKKKRKTYTSLDVNPKLPDGPNGTNYFSVTLLNPLKTGEAVTLEVLYILTESLEPFPSEISQTESQLVYYRDSAVILSPYSIEQQTTFIRTPSTRMESYTNVEPTNRAGLELKYGPYIDQPPHSFSPIIVHFENNNPFVVVEELVHEVEISHWGSIHVKEHYTVAHAGARLKGAFSRVPLEDFLYESTDGRKRYLNFTFGCPMAETVVNKFTIKVVLPEGSKNPTVVAPFTLEQHFEIKYSYLDVIGRPVVVLNKRNVVPEHNSFFQVYYDFNPAFMLSEPLMLVSVFLLFFLACIAYLHGDLSIQKNKTS